MRIFCRMVMISIFSSVLLILAWGQGRKAEPQRTWPMFQDRAGQGCPQPCIFGIMPGETTYRRALDIVATHPLTREGRTRQNTPDIPYPHAITTTADFVLTMTPDYRGMVYSVRLTWRHDVPSLEDFALQFGLPSGAQGAQQACTGLLYVHYGENLRLELPAVPVLRWDTDLLALRVQPRVAGAALRRWQGVGSTALYGLRHDCATA